MVLEQGPQNVCSSPSAPSLTDMLVFLDHGVKKKSTVRFLMIYFSTRNKCLLTKYSQIAPGKKGT